MDLMILDDTTNQATTLLENYDSLIWSERFNTVGDFELKAGDISGFMAALPEGKRVTIRESNIAMVVETHHIERKKNQPESVTIKGRSFESILDRRVVVKNASTGNLQAGAEDLLVTAYIPSDVAWYIIDQICVQGYLDANDIFPSSIVVFPQPSDYLTNTGPSRSFNVPKGNLLDKVLELIQTSAKADATTVPATPVLNPKGIRAVRPAQGSTAISIQFYSGTDRTSTILFDATRNLLDDGSYLFSKVLSANTAYILGPATTAKLNKTAVAASGLARRVILVDATASGVVNAGTLQKQGEQSLSEAPEIAVFDGSINAEISPYKFGVDYFLGDTVRLVGDYGLVQNAIVTEYIRSEDNTGTKGYPTLATIS